jgi:hypothetical protein
MLTRAASAVLLLVLAAGGAAGCAANDPEPAAAPLPSASAAPSDVTDLPTPSTGKPAGGALTISGTVSAGVEPNCLLLQDGGTTHLLILGAELKADPATAAAVTAGKKVTLVGRSEPSMMSTCQQGVPFMVTSVRPG